MLFVIFYVMSYYVICYVKLCYVVILYMLRYIIFYFIIVEERVEKGNGLFTGVSLGFFFYSVSVGR